MNENGASDPEKGRSLVVTVARIVTETEIDTNTEVVTWKVAETEIAVVAMVEMGMNEETLSFKTGHLAMIMLVTTCAIHHVQIGMTSTATRHAMALPLVAMIIRVVHLATLRHPGITTTETPLDTYRLLRELATLISVVHRLIVVVQAAQVAQILI